MGAGQSNQGEVRGIALLRIRSREGKEAPICFLIPRTPENFKEINRVMHFLRDHSVEHIELVLRERGGEEIEGAERLRGRLCLPLSLKEEHLLKISEYMRDSTHRGERRSLLD